MWHLPAVSGGKRYVFIGEGVYRPFPFIVLDRMALTHKQRRFVDAFLGESNGNASEAARVAGYAIPGQQGYENLKKPEIAAEITRLYAEKCMGPDEVLARLADQARGIGNYVRCLDRQRPYVDIQALQADGKAHLVRGIKYTDKGQCIVEFYDAQTALLNIGRHHELFTDKQKSEGTLNLIYDDLSEDEIDRRIAAAEGGQAPQDNPEAP
jgi:phage terminase small subunit